jgi:hypothetical protein
LARRKNRDDRGFDIPWNHVIERVTVAPGKGRDSRKKQEAYLPFQNTAGLNCPAFAHSILPEVEASIQLA